MNANPKCPLCGGRSVYIGISGSAQPACIADCHLHTKSPNIKDDYTDYHDAVRLFYKSVRPLVIKVRRP